MHIDYDKFADQNLEFTKIFLNKIIYLNNNKNARYLVQVQKVSKKE